MVTAAISVSSCVASSGTFGHTMHYSYTLMIVLTSDIGVMVLHLMLNCFDVQTGRTPFLHAAFNGHVHVVKLLLRKGAAVDAVDEAIFF